MSFDLGNWISCKVVILENIYFLLTISRRFAVNAACNNLEDEMPLFSNIVIPLISRMSAEMENIIFLEQDIVST